MPGQSYLFFACAVGSHTDSVSLSYVFIVLIMFSQHSMSSKSIFMNLKPIISFSKLSAINKASQFISGSEVDQSPSYIMTAEVV